MSETQPEQRIQTVCLLILTAVAVGGTLYFLRGVLIPFVVAILLSYCLTPLIDVQLRYLRIRRGFALINTALLGCIALGLTWFMIWNAVQELAQNADEYEGQIVAVLNAAAAWAPLEWLGLEPTELKSMLEMSEETARATFAQLLGGVMAVLSNGTLVFIFLIFMLAGKVAGQKPGSFRDRVNVRVKRFLVTKVAISAVTAVLVGLTLTALRVPFALPFSVLVFLLNFIPSIGSIIATLLPLPVIVLSPEMSVMSKVLAIAIPGVAQFTIGNVIEPRIMGDYLELHPVTVLLGLIFFGTIWGVIGMFLATPIVAVIKIILERIEPTRGAAVLMSTGSLDGMDGEANARTGEGGVP